MVALYWLAGIIFAIDVYLAAFYADVVHLT